MNKAIKIGAIVLAIGVCIIIGLAPIGPMPGIFIGGTETSVPDNWENAADIGEIQLKVAGTIPRVVIIWVIDYNDDLYVVGSQKSGWVKMLGDGGDVQMRLEEKTYNLSAERITTAWEPVVTAYADKYRPEYPDIVNSFPPVEEADGIFGVFKLSK
ncbi:MAG: hypothetical protein ACJAVI_000348 [Candidatus Azotimanducaceae bacterium]|jgi:hypothetical protein